MIKRLLELLEVSSAPYSHFNVAAIVVDSKGNKYEGVNVESAAYGATLCAERNAISSAITAGMKPGTVTEVHIIARNQDKKILPVTACGICRQVIAEQSHAKAMVYRYNENGLAGQELISDLLPGAFLGEDL